MADSEIISKIIEAKRNMYIKLNDEIWECAETRFKEYKSSNLLCSALEDEGFQVIKGIAGMETAFVASYGSGKPKIGILGEFDALYDLSQKDGCAEKKPVVEGGSGHGCGHNTLGTAAMAAAIAVKDYIKANNIKGTVCYFGCPGEEGGSGKTYMARDKVFDDIDAAFSWHPDSINQIIGTSSLANIQAYFKFNGLSSHAAICPHLGRSALDAAALMNAGVNFLREHIIPEARVHYAVKNAGGLSPNVVQSEAELIYLVRAPKMEQLKEIYNRVVNIAKGAALMTDTKLEIVFDKAASNIIINDTLSKLMYDKMVEIGTLALDEKDMCFAEEIRKTFSKEEKDNVKKYTGNQFTDRAVCDFIVPYKLTESAMPGSTDVGDVSWVVPTAQCNIACYALGTPGHSWQLVSQGKSDLCHKGMLYAGKVMALSALELFENNEIIIKAKNELNARLEGKSYVCPIPSEVKPNALR